MGCLKSKLIVLNKMFAKSVLDMFYTEKNGQT